MQPRTDKIGRSEMERACRMYNSNKEVKKALHIGQIAFNALVEKYEIETPSKRRERRYAG